MHRLGFISAWRSHVIPRWLITRFYLFALAWDVKSEALGEGLQPMRFLTKVVLVNQPLILSSHLANDVKTEVAQR